MSLHTGDDLTGGYPVARDQTAGRARLRSTFSTQWEARLDAELDQLSEFGCILVEAPAGFGKSRLISRWRRLLVGSGRTVHAISCSATIKLDHLLTTIETLTLAGDPSLGEAQNACRLEKLITAWEAAEEGFVLLLDDVDAAPSEVMDAVATIATRLPAHCQMVVSARTMPNIGQARLIAGGRLRVLAAPQLVLSRQEARECLQEAGERGCSAPALAHMIELCGGWLIALQTAAQFIHEAVDPNAAAFALDGNAPLSDWLEEHVWAYLDSADRDFLVELAPISQEVLDASLVSALTGESGIELRLTRLHAATPFFKRDEDGEVRLRPLVAAFLHAMRGDTGGEHARRQHERATQWLASQSSPQAVAHAIASGDIDQACRLVEEVLLAAVSHGMGREALDWLKSVPLNMLRLNTTTVSAMAVLGHRAAVLAWLANTPEDPLDIRSADTRLIIQAVLAAGGDDPDLTQELLAKLSPNVEMPDAVLSVERNLRRWLEQQQGSNKTFISTTLPADDVRRDVRQFSTGYCTAVFRDAEVLLDSGQAKAAERLVRRARQVAAKQLGEHANPTVQLTAGLAAACRQLGNVDEARTLMLSWPEADTDWMASSTLWLGHATIARVAARDGKVDAAIATLRRLLETTARRDLIKVRAQALAEIIRLALASGRTGVARDAAENLRDLCDIASDLGYIRGGLTRLAGTLGLTLFAIHQGDRPGARSLLDTAVELAGRHSRTFDLATTALLRRTIDNAGPAAPHVDDPLLMIGEADLATLETDIDVAINRRDSAPKYTAPASRRPNELAVSLTVKEREVLELMSRGVPKRLIAEALLVSPETIKWHQKNIYSKFDVRDRHNVVQVARRLGIV